ncbi:glycosyltransferase [Burkholderiaceae bacterium UC74_6]
MPSPVITLSIVSHGHGPLLTGLLEDLARHWAPVPYRIVLTLNLHDEVFRVEDWPALDIKIVRNEIPQGFGANHNAAFQYCDTPWFAVLNPDLRLPTNPFPPLLERAARMPTLGVIAPRIVDSAGHAEDSVRENLTPWSLVRRKIDASAGRIDPGAAGGKFFWLAGMFMMFPAAAYRQVRGFDERFFLYCEDYDLCARLSRAGFAVVMEPAATSVHDAQRDSRRSRRHLQWHLTSLLKVWLSSAFWWVTFSRAPTPEGSLK